ncbi:hypothetical protein QTP88_026091 [Uroleucon formosanum]
MPKTKKSKSVVNDLFEIFVKGQFLRVPYPNVLNLSSVLVCTYTTATDKQKSYGVNCTQNNNINNCYIVLMLCKTMYSDRLVLKNTSPTKLHFTMMYKNSGKCKSFWTFSVFIRRLTSKSNNLKTTFATRQY